MQGIEKISAPDSLVCEYLMSVALKHLHYRASDTLQRNTCKLCCTELHKVFPSKTHLKEVEEQCHSFM